MKTRNIAGFALAVGAFFARPAAAQDDAPCKFEAPGPSDFSPAFEGTVGSGQEKSPSVESVREGGKKHFFRAAGELALLEVGPWAFDRYIHRYDFAFISGRTVSENLKTGFQFDHDDFSTNQSWHPPRRQPRTSTSTTSLRSSGRRSSAWASSPVIVSVRA